MRLLIGLASLGILGLASCITKNVPHEPSSDVYMSFQMSQVSSTNGVRAQGSSPSVNTDVKDREDFVSRFGAFVFETGTSGTKVAEKFSEQAFFVMKFKKGTYDFYFIANYPTSDEASLSQMSKSQLEDYLKTLKPYTLHNVPLSAGPFFPMARVYRNQTISGNGTMMAPIPFKPVVGTTNQLMPISSLGNDWQSTSNIQDQVRLVRANAKIDLNVTGVGVPDVVKVEYYNAVRNYTLAELDPRPANPAVLTTPLAFNYTAPASTGTIETKLYVPERLFNDTETKGWDAVTDQVQGGVNYIQITMKSGRVYRIPVVSNGPATGYQTFAKDATRADYNVIRNHHYKYDIAIAKDAKELVVKALVLPWTLVESEISFGKIEFDKEFLLSAGDATMSGDKKTIEVHQQTPVTVKFKLKGPKGAIWRATLTNGLDFSLKADGTNGGVSGIADPNTEYTMVVTPLKPFEGTPRLTEFFITVNGTEVPLVTDSEEIGPGKRYVFKQVE